MSEYSISKRLDDLSIDKYSLHEEWANQGRDRYRYEEKYSAAVEIRDRVKADLKEAEGEYKRILSEKFIDIKKNPSLYGFNSTSDAVANNLAVKDKEVVKVFGNVIRQMQRLAKMEKQVNRLAGMLSSFIDRRKGLEGLVSLWLNKYYSQNPRIQEMADDILGEERNEYFTKALNEADPDLAERLKNKRKEKGDE